MSNQDSAIEYFEKFRNAILEEYFDDMRELRTFPSGSYKSFENDHEIIQLQRNIYHNLNEVFQNLEIPNAEFQSHEQILIAWHNFLTLLESYDDTIENCFKSDPEPSYVLVKINKNREKLITALKESIKLFGQDIPEQISQVPKTSIIKEEASYFCCFMVVLFDSELSQLLKCFHSSKQILVDDGSRTIYYEVKLNQTDKQPSIVACSNQMGLTSASTQATNIIRQFNPKYVFMSGICAGISGKIGDILIGDVFWDYGSGKIESNNNGEEEFKPYRNPEKIDNEIFKKIITYSGRTELTRAICSNYDFNQRFTDFSSDLEVKIGPFVSGAAVVANSNVKTMIKKQEGKLIGFDMEAYGVIYAANNASNKSKTKCMIVKSISDLGDENKNTKEKGLHQQYAAYTSARFITELIKNGTFE